MTKTKRKRKIGRPGGFTYKQVHTIQFQLRFGRKIWHTHSLLIPATTVAEAVKSAWQMVKRDYLDTNALFEARNFVPAIAVPVTVEE